MGNDPGFNGPNQPGHLGDRVYPELRLGAVSGASLGRDFPANATFMGDDGFQFSVFRNHSTRGTNTLVDQITNSLKVAFFVDRRSYPYVTGRTNITLVYP